MFKRREENKTIMREIESVRKSQMELLQKKNTLSKMNNTLDKINKWLNTAGKKKRSVIFEDIVIETSQNETEKKPENE